MLNYKNPKSSSDDETTSWYILLSILFSVFILIQAAWCRDCVEMYDAVDEIRNMKQCSCDSSSTTKSQFTAKVLDMNRQIDWLCMHYAVINTTALASTFSSSQ